MGYFSNGTEGEDYFDAYCSKCIHDINEDCPVWQMHLLYSYELCNADKDPGKQMLDMLIPPTSDGLYNKRCTMFVARSASGDLFEAPASP
jgi:hypothetical protein